MKKHTRHFGKNSYAVAGFGNIGQNLILPGFFHVRKYSVLTAPISNPPIKLRQLFKDYGVENSFSYKDNDVCLRSGLSDAVNIPPDESTIKI